MESDIIKKFSNLLQVSGESRKIRIHKSDLKEPYRWKNCLVFKLLSDQGLNFIGMKESIHKAWNPKGNKPSSSRDNISFAKIYIPRLPVDQPIEVNMEWLARWFDAIFSESEIVEYSIQENTIEPGKVEVLIDNKQHYKIFGKDVDLASLIRLNIDEGKVVHHEDWWDKKALKNRDTVKLPLIGRVAEITRRGSMLMTHAIMGFGKDPSP